MKTLTHSTQILMLLGILFFMNAHTLKSQPSCSYLIVNSLDCSITVQVDYFDDCITPLICNSQTVTVAATTPQPVYCSGCAHLCKIQVTLVTAGGASNGAIVDTNNTAPNIVSVPAACSGGSGSLSITCGDTVTDFSQN